MNYEKLYKEALERAKRELNSPDKRLIEFIFPELKESDDERIKKSLLDYLHTLPNHFSHNGSLVIDWIAWLEKQGKKESIKTCADSEFQHWNSFIYTILSSLREQLKRLIC